MMLHRHLPALFQFHRFMLCGALCLLMLHCIVAKPLSAGSECNNGSGNDTCADGLACMPETPGSEISVCKDADSNNSSCDLERCLRVWCSPNLQYIPDGACCPLCPEPPIIHLSLPASPLGCTENNVHYEEGESWQRDACISCTCEAGLSLCSSLQCAVPDCEILIMIPGQCCPTCAAATLSVVQTECEYGGQTYQHDEMWNDNGDPCITCSCENGETLCLAQQCLVDCDDAVYLPDTCCPICPDVNTETASHLPVPTSLPNPSPATLTLVTISPPTAPCEYGNQVYDHGASWNPNNDPCTTCYCDDGFHFCIAQSCYAPCDQNDLVFLPGICCPLCPGDEGYPSQSVTIPNTKHLSPSTTQHLPMSPSSTVHTMLSPTPPHSGGPTPVTGASTPSAETRTSTTALRPSELPASICTDSDDVEWTDGESWCPLPSVKATCHSGTISYTEHICPVTDCQDPTWTAGSCDCPVCHDYITVSVILDMDYRQYLKEEDEIRLQLEEAFKSKGLDITDIRAMKYGHKQTQVIFSVSSPTGDATLMDKESLHGVVEHLNSPAVSSLRFGHHEERKSVSRISSHNIQLQSQSNEKSSQMPSKTVIIIVATVSIALAVTCAVVIAVTISRKRKIRSKTVTV